jgi:hypothetical protein
MAIQIVTHNKQESNKQLPELVEVEGQMVHAPIVEDGLLIVDTGRSILDLDPTEIPVLRAVIAAWDAHQVPVVA